MNSDQLPPPLANFTFPPDNTVLQFNYLDTFVTSWVTPQSSQDPCFFSIYYWNDSGSEPWTSKLNQTVSLNGTRLVSLAFVDSDGLCQLNLNYVDPLGGHKKIQGTSFHISHDLAQSKAMTWNQGALSQSTTTQASTQASSVSISSAYTTPIPSSYTTPAPPSSTRPIPLYTPTATQSSDRASSSSHSAETASITLGTILGVVLTAALLIFWIRRKRPEKLAEQAVHVSSAAPALGQRTTVVPHEIAGEVVLNEMGDESGRWEMDTNRR